MTAPHPATTPPTPEDNAAYLAGLCRDCHEVPYSPGRTRCAACHATYQNPPAPPIEEYASWPTTDPT